MEKRTFSCIFIIIKVCERSLYLKYFYHSVCVRVCGARADKMRVDVFESTGPKQRSKKYIVLIVYSN